MSDYPPASHYGAHYGPPDQNHQPPYPPPAFPNQYPHSNVPHAGNYPYQMPPPNLENSQAAYSYNQGLPNVAPGMPPALPPYQTWPVEPMAQQPYTAPQSVVPPQAYQSGYYNPQMYTAPPPPQSQPPYNPYTRPAEEGELSEGEFDYNGNSAGPGGYHASNSWANDGSGFSDTAQRAVYARNQDRNASQPYRSANDYDYGRNSPQVRQASNSYSPNASPAQMEYEPLRRDKRQNSTLTGNKNSQKAGRVTPKSKHVVPSYTQPQNNGQRTISGGQHPRVKGTPEPMKPQTQTTQLDATIGPEVNVVVKDKVISKPLPPNPDLSKARKDAQAAAEELSKLGDNISMQILMAEGLDETLVEKYFPKIKTLGGSSSNHSNIIQKSSQSATNGTATVTAPAPKPTGPTEKERTLQLKMEALRKSREERAQKNAAKTNIRIPSAEPSKAEKPATPVEKPSASPLLKELAPTPQENQESGMQPTSPAAPSHIPSTQPINILPSAAQPSQVLSIPGLFLNSSNANATPSAITNNPELATAHSNSRKRPVAADFDTPSFVPPKRPFGQSRSEKPLVIDVSDEEADSDEEDVAMDLESQYDQNSPIQSTRTLSDNRAAAISNLPQLSDFPSRKPFSTPPSVSDTTPPAYPSATKSMLGKPEDLQRKMQEIADMKKKIADAERRKKAKQNSSGTNTPRRIESNGSESGRIENNNLSSKVEAAIQIERLVTMAESKATKDQQKLADTQLAESEKAAELERVEAEQKRLRHEKLTKDLPLVDAGVLQKQNQLAQLQAEMARIQAAIEKDLADKQRIIEERERLGQEAENQLQEQKDKLKDLNDQDKQDNTVSSLPTPGAPEVDSTSHPSPVVAEQKKSPLPAETSTKQHIDDPTTLIQENSPSAPISASPSNPKDDDNDNDDASVKMDIESVATPDEILEAALQEAVRAEVESHEVVDSKSSDVDMEDSYAPDPSQLEPDHASSQAEDPIQSPVASPVLKRKQIKGSDGESDDYEPPEATPPGDAPDEYEPPEATPPIDMHDDYEPPEASPILDAPATDLSPQPLPESPPFSPAPPENSVERSEQAPSDSPAVTSLSIGNHEQDTTEEMISPQSHLLRRPMVEKEPDNVSSEALQIFTPYDSPLKHFRAYRFHPHFKQEVPGGYRSITYSHKSNPSQELCRYELAGGFCNDGDCDLQHFRNIGLSDNDILASLTSHTEFSGEQRGKFVSGLKEVFADLREKNLDKDFDTIASALVAHRAQFLGDSSKVLMLEGTTI